MITRYSLYSNINNDSGNTSQDAKGEAELTRAASKKAEADAQPTKYAANEDHRAAREPLAKSTAYRGWLSQIGGIS